ncbi:CcoQ/FixQ family Cbb3-type cytochrome c oxidase assembly chaperone [Nitratireductor sp. StC3]|nr:MULTISPECIES: cbb3-type cytochrome c oxidase subunit 3 [Nitratireductor]PSM18540.1 CcoQ/FixQ family Cbb3-type cytochrome c oxidase assembly chaperone [Nitratireductor sp. StC3]
MDISHDTLVGISKSYGLFYLIALSIGAGAYALWPANGKKFERAAKSVLKDEEGPWR